MPFELPSKKTGALSTLFLVPLILVFTSHQPLFLSLVLYALLWLLALNDWLSFRLPNLLIAGLFAFGAAYVVLVSTADPLNHLIGAAVGLVILPLINFIYKKLRGKDGIGLGDAKLLACAGLWLGWAALPFVLLIASVSGLVYAIASAAGGKQLNANVRLPFGAFLCLAIWLLWLFSGYFPV